MEAHTQDEPQGLQTLLGNINIEALKEPRGFMKILQFLFGISAFATTTSFATQIAFKVACDEKTNFDITQDITYPFEIDSYRQLIDQECIKSETLILQGDFASDSRFFVAIGVLAFLYILAALVIYCLFTTLYENNPLAPLVDCAVHIFFAFMWLAASSAWANSLSGLKSTTDVDVVMSENPKICSDPITCTKVSDPNYAKLNISIILGFLNLFLWGSNIWFLYKETHFFKAKSENIEGNVGGQNTIP